MNRDFSRNMTFLRKEKKLSQKQAAQDLGISQALLSHYEKGIRECGLDFVVKAADYYNVSCDYLLGRTAEREYEISEAAPDREAKKQSAAQMINRRLTASIINVIYDYSASAKNRKLDRTITNYIMIALYKVFRQLYSGGKSESSELFAVSEELYGGYADAVMIKSSADISSMTDPNSESYLAALAEAEHSPEKLAEEYPESAGEIFSVIHQAENALLKIRS